MDVGSGFWQFGAWGGVLPPKREEPLASHLAGGPLRAPCSLLPVPSSGTHAWQGKDGLGRPGPRSCGSSEGQLVLHKSWAPRSWGPTGKRAPLRAAVPAARWPGPAMRGPTRPPGDSAVGGGGGCAEPKPARRERPESAGHPPCLPAWRPGGGSPPRGCPHSKQPGCCRPGEKQIDPMSRSKFSPSPRPGSSAAERAGPWTFPRHRPPAPGLPPAEFSPAQGKALLQRTGTVRGPVGDTRKVGSVSARLRRLGEGSLKTGGAGQQRAQGAAHHGARGRCAEEMEQRGWP